MPVRDRPVPVRARHRGTARMRLQWGPSDVDLRTPGARVDRAMWCVPPETNAKKNAPGGGSGGVRFAAEIGGPICAMWADQSVLVTPLVLHANANASTRHAAGVSRCMAMAGRVRDMDRASE